MSSFMNPHFPQEHLGASRLAAAVETVQALSSHWTAARGLVALLLSAVLAAAVAVAYQVMDTVEEGHLLALWTGLWAAVFAGVVYWSGTLSRIGAATKAALNAWAQRQAKARADARLWQIASTDARVMADLRNAMSREEALGGDTSAQASVRPETSTSDSSRQQSYGFNL